MKHALLSRDDIRAAESAWTDAHPRTPLMSRAGKAIAQWALSFLKQHKTTPRQVLILAGPGNNGGDAWVAADLLAKAKCRISVLALGEHKFKEPVARQAHASYKKSGTIVRSWSEIAGDAESFGLIIDGLFGSGLQRAPSGAFANAIRGVNTLRVRHGTTVLAIDVPSGVDADRGMAFDAAIEADHTLTFIAHKPGLMTGDGLDHAGSIQLDTLGVEPPAGSNVLLTREGLLPLIAPRPRTAHKGTFGNVGILGGADGIAHGAR
jgi:hydroxyethylthiazole kinase-like uncharacterized protein yjeF